MSHGTSIYFDTDSTGAIFLCEKQFSGKNVDFVKRTPVSRETAYLLKDIYKSAKVNSSNAYGKAVLDSMSKEDLKGILNCKYGKVVSDTMRKDYITVHINGKVGIVFKCTIAAILKANDSNAAKIIQHSGVTMIVDEDYSAIVKAILS